MQKLEKDLNLNIIRKYDKVYKFKTRKPETSVQLQSALHKFCSFRSSRAIVYNLGSGQYNRTLAQYVTKAGQYNRHGFTGLTSENVDKSTI